MYSVRRIDRALSRTGNRYIDVAGWCEISGVSEEVAKEQLALGVELGHFDRCYLYEWPDAPIPFVIPEGYLDRTVQMHEVGYFGDDEDAEIHVSPLKVREIFVARGSQQQ